MKIKMVKMGMDIDETRNYRIRGIIPTKDGKYLFVEIQQGNRPDIRYTSLSKNEYNLKYPNQEYIYLDAIFRVDMPKDYYHYYSSEFSSFERPYYELNYTNENIVSDKTIKLIRMFYYVDIEKISKIDISQKSKNEINIFLDDYYSRYTGLYLKSKKFIKNLQKLTN